MILYCGNRKEPVVMLQIVQVLPRPMELTGIHCQIIRMCFVNWQEKVFGRKAKFSTHNVAVSGGNQPHIQSSLTAKEEGVQIESGFDRKLVNFKIDHKASDKLRVGFTARYLDQEIQGTGTTNSGTRATNRLRHTINYRPFELQEPDMVSMILMKPITWHPPARPTRLS